MLWRIPSEWHRNPHFPWKFTLIYCISAIFDCGTVVIAQILYGHRDEKSWNLTYCQIVIILNWKFVINFLNKQFYENSLSLYTHTHRKRMDNWIWHLWHNQCNTLSERFMASKKCIPECRHSAFPTNANKCRIHKRFSLWHNFFSLPHIFKKSALLVNTTEIGVEIFPINSCDVS